MPEPTDENDKPVEPLFEAPPAPHPDGALFEKPRAALFEVPPTPHVELSLVPDLAPATPNPRPTGDDQRRRAQSIAQAYCRIRPMATLTQVRAIVLRAIKDGRWTDDEIREAVLYYAGRAWRINADGLEGHLKRSAGHVAGTASRSTPTKKTKAQPRQNPILPQKTAVYRFYDADGVLLYVGKTPAPVERFHEHRDEKPWWKEVTHHSIAWWNTPEQALAKEEFAIKDEWPIYNSTHQPRNSGGYRIPSHIADVILQVVREAVVDKMPEATEEQIGDIVMHVADAFDVQNSDNQIEPTWGMWFGKSQAPMGLEVTDLEEMRRRMGSLRPEIDGSARLKPLADTTEEES